MATWKFDVLACAAALELELLSPRSGPIERKQRRLRDIVLGLRVRKLRQQQKVAVANSRSMVARLRAALMVHGPSHSTLRESQGG
jgi:hypothetical protein